MLRTAQAVAVAAVALIGLPAAAAVVTTSTLSSAAGDTEHALSDSNVESALWVWGGTGVVGVGAMIAFGTTARRGERRRRGDTAAALNLAASMPVDIRVHV